MSTIPERLAALRAQMARAGVDAYLVPSTDPHQSEYVPACWQRRAWLSGFTGSAGDLLVTRDAAGLWTDGRYFAQAEAELRGSGIALFKAGLPGVPRPGAWLAETLPPGAALGVDPRLLTPAGEAELRRHLDPAGIRLKLVASNLVDRIWRHRPATPADPVEAHPRRFAGAAVREKLAAVRAALDEARADALVVTALDAVAWLFNLRGRDVPFNPVAIAHGLVTRDGATLFIDPGKVPRGVARALGRGVTVAPPQALAGALRELGRARAAVWVDPATTNLWIRGRLRGARLVERPSPIARLKARKNDTEIAGARAAHLRDGVAMVRFLAWLSEAVPAGGVTELSAAERLLAFRAEGEHFRGQSFDAISGYGPHGAIIHYRVTPESDVPLRPRGLYLVDSGGQYRDGTTDITRTLLLGGRPTRAQRDRFTRVLKGHIAISRLRFPAGTAGRQIDALARLALWRAGLDYQHGTGHGVGAYLNVHEGPQSISATRCTGVPLEPGNILSNEPGFYETGAYGIRIENLELVARDEALSQGGRDFLRFETLTLCPIDTRLVAPELLDDGERRWLDRYHARVRRALAPHLAPAERRWLRAATGSI